MRTFAQHMAIYQHNHQHFLTKMTHFIGVPMIVFAMMLLLNWIQLHMPGVFTLTLTWTIVFILMIYYILLHPTIGSTTAAILIVLAAISYYVSHTTPNMFGFKCFLFFFIIGWIFQLLSYFFEETKPAWIEALCILFIAPIFLVAEIYFMLGYLENLQHEIEQTEHIYVSDE